MSCRELTVRLKSEAIRLGFDAVGIAPAVAPPGYPDFLRWLEAGPCRRNGIPEPERSSPGASRAACSRAFARSSWSASSTDRPRSSRRRMSLARRGKVAQYARGGDYHALIWRKLEELLEWLRAEYPDIRGRAVADTAPLLERDFARLAGLGWIGKNTMLISRRLGSFTFLGALLVDAELELRRPARRRPLRNLHALPGRLPDAGVRRPVPARRPALHQLLDHRAQGRDQPRPNAAKLDGWVFGCDICQDVCPWNRKAPPGQHAEFDARPEWTDPDLIEWLTRDAEEWKARLKGTALTRAKRAGWCAMPRWCWAAARLAEAVGSPGGSAGRLLGRRLGRARSAAWALGADRHRAAQIRSGAAPRSIPIYWSGMPPGCRRLGQAAVTTEVETSKAGGMTSRAARPLRLSSSQSLAGTLGPERRTLSSMAANRPPGDRAGDRLSEPVLRRHRERVRPGHERNHDAVRSGRVGRGASWWLPLA